MADVLKFPLPPPSGQAPADGERSKALSQSKLTELRVEKLPVTGKTYYLNDAAQPGLSLRVSAGGVKAFVFTKFKHGKFIQITLGRTGAMRLDAARRAAQKLHGELAQGIDILARRKAAGAAHTPSETMEQAFARFLTLKARRPTTLTDYHYLWKQHIPAGLKRKAVADVTAVDIESAKRAVGKHHRTSNKVVALLSAILARSGRRMDNPAQETIRHAEHPRTRRLSIDELTKVWSAAEREPEWKDFFRLLILTGARRSPFQAMRWRDLDLDAGVWLVPVEWAKSKREMALPLSIEALRILKARREALTHESAWVWPSSDSETGHVINPVKAWRRLLSAAGVHEHASLHDIRRTLGSRLAMDGVAGATISKVLGHVSPQSLKHYVHLDVAAGGEAIDRLFADLVKDRSRE
jgi:integrase